MTRTGPHGPRVWHARRNSEMIFGLFLKYFLGKKLHLIFTSASQRKHTWISRLLIQKMDAVVSTSNATAFYLERSSLVIHHGIDLNGFTPVDDREALKERLGLPQAELVGCYGRIRAQKGTDIFVDAMLSLLPQYPQFVAVVMGRATPTHQPYLQDLHNRVRVAGLEERVLFLPEVPVEQMADWYRVLDLFVAPQRWEGFGLTPLEAMACGVPVVATRTGAFEELIIDSQVGYLIPPDNLNRLAERCARLLGSRYLRHTYGQNARTHVEKNFSISSEAHALNNLYLRFLSRA